MLDFIVTFVMFAIADFMAVWWAKSIDKSKPIHTGLSAAGIMFLSVASMWIAFVGESTTAASGMVIGSGIGAYIGCKYYNS